MLSSVSGSRGLWFAYFAGLLVMAGAGAVYSFSSYAQVIKAHLNWRQEEIELVGELLHAGVYMGPVIGIFVDIFSPSINFAIAGFMTSVGYFMAGVMVGDSSASYVSSGSLGMMFYLIGFGSGLIYTTTLACVIRNFADFEQFKNSNPEQNNEKKPNSRRGIIVATLVSLYGFGAMIFSGLFNLINSTPTFLKAMAFALAFEAIIGTLFVKRVKFFNFPSADVEPIESRQDTDELTSSSNNSSNVPASNGQNAMEELTLVARFKKMWFCLLKLARDPVFWFSFIAFILGTGGGLMYINNVGNLVKSLHGGVEIQQLTFACVSLLSVFNGLGRILMGFTDYSTWRRGTFYFLALLSMAFAQLLNAIILTKPTIVYFTTVLVGLSYGMLWSITPTLASEIFGAEEFGMVWGWYTFGPSIASFLFNSVAGAVYEAHAPSESKNCTGKSCYQNSFIFASLAALVGSGFAFAIIKKTKPGKPKSELDEQAVK